MAVTVGPGSAKLGPLWEQFPIIEIFLSYKRSHCLSLLILDLPIQKPICVWPPVSNVYINQMNGDV
jgi:hypothetical protein